MSQEKSGRASPRGNILRRDPGGGRSAAADPLGKGPVPSREMLPAGRDKGCGRGRIGCRGEKRGADKWFQCYRFQRCHREEDIGALDGDRVSSGGGKKADLGLL